MVNNTIHATYTETYDLNTINSELSLLAIHTPQAPALKRMFKGFFEQYRKFKVLGCNFRMVCASQQALDPTLVGMEAGQIDPRDVLNPILFKACTGEGMNALLDQIYNASEAAALSNTGHSVDQHIDSRSHAINAYYSLLADDSFRKEHPQKGITVMGLKPMVHKVVTTQPFKWSVGPQRTNGIDNPHIAGSTNPTTGANVNAFGFGGQSGSSTNTSDPVNASVFVSNGVTEMPWLDTAYSHVKNYVSEDASSSGSAKAYSLVSNVPRVYMGCMILPPSMGTMNLYFRLQVVWHILFKDFRPCQDLFPVIQEAPIDEDDIGTHELSYSGDTYYNMYHTSSKLSKDVGSIDTSGVEDIEIVNEKVA